MDEQTARKALSLIAVKYKKLPHVTDVDEAMDPKAVVIHKNVFTRGVEPKPSKPSNIAARTQMGHGDIEAGFSEADFIVEKSYKTEQTHQVYRTACLSSFS